MDSTAIIQSSTRCRCYFRGMLAVILLAGCDKLPEPAADDEPDPGPVVAAPPPVDVTPSVPRTPEQVIDEFLAVQPTLRTDEHLQALSELEEGLDGITELNLRQSGVSDIGGAELEKFVTVTKLDLSSSRVTSAVTEHIARMTALEELNLSDLPIENESLEVLSELPSLRAISLGRTAVHEDCFIHLAECESLERVSITDNGRLLGNGFSALLVQRKFATLRELTVNHTGFGYHGMDQLNRLPQLEVLNVANAEVTDPALDGIRSCTSLRTLNLTNNRLTDAALQRLVRLKDLEELDVSGCLGITDAGLRHLRGHEQLRRLSLQGTSCSVAGATDLKEKFLENTTILINNQEL